jgi:hypothetical protein
MLSIKGKGQIVRFFSTGRVDDKAYRIEIKADSVKPQGRAVLEIWSETSSCWNELSSLTGTEMSTDSHIGYRPKPPEKDDFWNDIESLIGRAKVTHEDPEYFGEALAEALFDEL